MSLDYESATPNELAEHFAALARQAGTSKTQTSVVRRGVRAVLALTDGQPGGTWQHRWVAADADAAVLATLNDNDNRTGKASRHELRAGLVALVGAGILRPGLHLLLDRRFTSVVTRGLGAKHAADLDRLAAAAGSRYQVSEEGRCLIRSAALAMIVFAGRPLNQITPEEWASAHRQRQDITRNYTKWMQADLVAKKAGLPRPPKPDRKQDPGRLLALSVAYAAAVDCGLISPSPNPAPGHQAVPPTLGRAVADPATLDNALARLGTALPPRVRSLVRDAYILEGGGLDYSTVCRGICDLNTYMKFVLEALPGHDSLDIPIEARAQVLDSLRKTPVSRRRPGTYRLSIAGTLQAVRSVYNMCDAVVTRHGLTEHLPASGAFPWPRNVISKLSKVEREQRRTRMHQSVREHLGHLDGLVQAAHDRLAFYDGLAAATHAAAPGTDFDYDGRTWRRADTTRGGQHGAGRRNIPVRLNGRIYSNNIDETANQAAKGRTLVVLLRETGTRIEEVAELAIENLIPFTDGDMTFPALAVNPSKQDRARTVGLAVNALEAVHDLVERNRALFGHDPLVHRTDEHEGIDQPPARLLFSILREGRFMGPSRGCLANWLNGVVDYYNEHANPGVPLQPVRPHQMRRLFATDLHERGADIVTIQKTLGHMSVQTTSIYVHADDAQAISAVVAARRQARAVTSGAQCACCNGLGYRNPDALHNP